MEPPTSGKEARCRSGGPRSKGRQLIYRAGRMLPVWLVVEQSLGGTARGYRESQDGIAVVDGQLEVVVVRGEGSDGHDLI